MGTFLPLTEFDIAQLVTRIESPSFIPLISHSGFRGRLRPHLKESCAANNIVVVADGGGLSYLRFHFALWPQINTPFVSSPS